MRIVKIFSRRGHSALAAAKSPLFTAFHTKKAEKRQKAAKSGKKRQKAAESGFLYEKAFLKAEKRQESGKIAEMSKFFVSMKSFCLTRLIIQSFL